MGNIFAKKLKDLRKEFGITQIELAQKFNIANGTVGNWESGNRQPDYETLQKIAAFFNVSIDYLLDVSIDSEAISHARQTVKKLAEEQDIPFEEIENKLGEKYATFRCWYNGIGDKFNEASQLAKIADLYGVSVDFLLGIEEPDDKKEKPIEYDGLSEGEQMLLSLFNQISKDKQQLVLEMIRAALKSQ